MTRSAGPLTLGTPFILGVRRLLTWNHWLSQRGGAPATELQVRSEIHTLLVDDVEDTLGTDLHDELLALLAFGLPRGTRLADLPDLRARARKKGLPSAWLPFAPEAAFVTPLRPREGEGLRVASWKPADGAVEMALAAPRFLERWLDQAMSSHDLEEGVAEAIEASGPGPLEIVLTEPPKVEAPPPERVRHLKFGLGTVLVRKDGKVEIAFDDGQKRTFLERFVERV